MLFRSEARKLHPRDIKMIKDDQGGTKNPYKCTNVMNKDAMDDKIKERCKTFEKNACKRISINREVSRSYRANLDGSNSYREAIEGTGTFLIDPPSYREVLRLRLKSIENLNR